MTETPCTRTLRRALEHSSSIEDLARLLGVHVTQLQNWLEGAAPVPPEVYLKALDLVASGPFWAGAVTNGTRH